MYIEGDERRSREEVRLQYIYGDVTLSLITCVWGSFVAHALAGLGRRLPTIAAAFSGWLDL